jgi:hypothetical protein
MLLLDSNIIIYSVDPAYARLQQFIAENSTAVSAISYLEVLGFHRIAEADRLSFERFFQSARLLPINRQVLARAVLLRQERRMSVGDALIAATALVHRVPLVTRNTADFNWIPGLQLVDPLSGNSSGH